MRKSHVQSLRQIFQKGVNSVQPATIFSTSKCILRVKPLQNGCEVLEVCGQSIELSADKKCHLIGVGKAVLGMAIQVERILGDRLKSGIVSIPVGTVQKFVSVPEMKLAVNSVVRVYEGALNNLPDRESMDAAINIKDLAASMTHNDVLFVLLSGGGSALLPLPIEPITLEQKSNLITILSRKGADIEELNIVRIAISQLKGGKLADLAKNAHCIFSLVISDIVNDPLHLIASGPTTQFISDGRTARDILEKYAIWDGLDVEIKEIILRKTEIQIETKGNSIHVIGSNKLATQACLEHSQLLGYKSCILSTSIVGSLDEVERKYISFLEMLVKFLKQEVDSEEIKKVYPFNECSLLKLLATIHSCKLGDSLCLILAGEPTAYVTGKGKGGRNQELALRMAQACHENPYLKEVCFLSAGTDGIDGPTDSAGAIGCFDVVDEFLKFRSPLDLQDYLIRNDSYNFYKGLNSKEFHISPGHTGTNVMDIHLITIPV